MRLDHHRAVSQIAEKINRPITSIEQMCVWGNHSPTMYADYRYATSNGESVQDMITEPDWNTEVSCRNRRTRCRHYRSTRFIIRGLRSQCRHLHLRDWLLGSSGKWITMGVPSDGSYGIPEGLIFGFPVICDEGSYRIVQGLDLSDEFSQKTYCRHAGRIGRRTFSHPGSTLKTKAETFAKKPFLQQPKFKHRFSAVFISNIH